MTHDEARKLVSGYSVGSLTELEKQLLFDEALDDQELFEELAGEQEVKELIALPGAKKRLLFALGPAKHHRPWLPWAVGFAAAAAVAMAVWVQWPAMTAPQTVAVEIARLDPPPAVPGQASSPAAAPPVTAADNRDAESAKSETPVPEPAQKEADAAVIPQATTLALADKAKATVREETAPVPAQLETRAQTQLPVLQPTRPPATSPAPSETFLLRTEAAMANPPPARPNLPLVPQAFVAGAPASVATRPLPVPGTLTYEVRNTGILRMTPSRGGVLEVTYDGRPLYSSRSVTPGLTIDLSIPLEARQLRIDFADDSNAPAVVAQSAGASGMLVLPASPNPRAAVVIPAQR